MSYKNNPKISHDNVQEVQQKEIEKLKKRCILLEQQYLSEKEAKEMLEKSLQTIKNQSEKKTIQNSNTSKLDSIDQKIINSSRTLNNELIQTNLNIMQGKMSAIGDLNSIIDAQSQEIERLNKYKTELFEMKKKELEIQKEMLTSKNNKKSLNEVEFKQEVEKQLNLAKKEAQEKYNKLKKQMLKNFDESEKKMEKINEKVFELEKKLKTVFLKQEKSILIVKNFKNTEEKFKKVIRFCFLKFSNLSERVNNGTRKIIFKLNKNCENKIEQLHELENEYNFLNKKLIEYHNIINKVGENSGVDFNQDSLETIYKILLHRKNGTQKMSCFLENLVGNKINDDDFNKFIDRISHCELKQGKYEEDCRIMLNLIAEENENKPE